MQHQIYVANEQRYSNGLIYARCGRSGIQLPKISLGFWHNFGGIDSFERSREIVRHAFDRGINHFDLANNYGPPYGSAEKNVWETHVRGLFTLPRRIVYQHQGWI